MHWWGAGCAVWKKICDPVGNQAWLGQGGGCRLQDGGGRFGGWGQEVGSWRRKTKNQRQRSKIKTKDKENDLSQRWMIISQD